MGARATGAEPHGFPCAIFHGPHDCGTACRSGSPFLLLAVAGSALAVGEWRGVAAVLLVLLAFVLKSRVEEERMRETFPEYETYRRERAALIPFVY